MAYKVFVEKNLEVEDQRSIIKTFFVMVGVQNTSIGIAIVALFLLSSNFYKMKIRTVQYRESLP